MGAGLALLVVALLVFVSCGVPGGGSDQEARPEIDELDDRAVAACELFTPISDDVRNEELTGPPLFRALQDVYNQARLSGTENFDFVVQELLNAAIVEDEQARDARLDQLDEICGDAR